MKRSSKLAGRPAKRKTQSVVIRNVPASYVRALRKTLKARRLFIDEWFITRIEDYLHRVDYAVHQRTFHGHYLKIPGEIPGPDDLT